MSYIPCLKYCRCGEVLTKYWGEKIWLSFTKLYFYLQRKGTDEHCSFSSAFEDGTFLRIYILSDFDNVNAFFDKAMKVNVI
jgi:hypothetical protein